MKYLADLYADGLINPNALTNDYSAFQSLSRGNEAGEHRIALHLTVLGKITVESPVGKLDAKRTKQIRQRVG